MSRLRSASAQLFALSGLIVLGLSIARVVDLELAYERMRLTGDGMTVAWLLELLGTVYLPLSGALLLGALVLSVPRGARLPRLRTRFLALVVFVVAFVVLVVVSGRAVDREALGLDLFPFDLAVGLRLAAAVPVAMLVTMLTASGLALWRATARNDA